MKKKLLFVIDSLVCAGAEKSLISLLHQLDYEKYEVDLQLFGYGGEFEKYIPEQVTLLEPLSYMCFFKEGIWWQIKDALWKGKWKELKSKMIYSWLLRTVPDLNNAAIARLFWEKSKNCIFPTSKHYDCAIAYAQAVPTFYVADKVCASQKMGWVNVSYHLQGREKIYQKDFYARLDQIVLVSDSALEVFKQVYPEFASKMNLVRDMIDPIFIGKLSQLPIKLVHPTDSACILTVARLNKPQKGYDIALKACKILKDRGIKFRWYALGRGSYEGEMRSFIQENNLESDFILLGTTDNPYPYFKKADLYVQTSRHEGFGLSIAEARLLNVPVVTTEFDAVYNQMIPEENGLVVPQDPVAVADAIERLLTDKKLYQHIVSFLKTEKKGNTEEMEKFYALIER